MSYSPGKVSSLGRAKGKDEARMSILLYYIIIRLIAIIPGPETLIYHAADDSLITLEDNAITCPVL